MKTRIRSRRLRRSTQPSDDLDESEENFADKTIPSELRANENDLNKAANKKINSTIIPQKVRPDSKVKNNLNNKQNISLSSSMTDTEFEKELFVDGNNYFGNSETPEKLTSDYFSGSDTPSKLKESTRRLSIGKRYSSYIAYSSDEELEEWWQEPKTDYTYSVSLSYRDRVTPERKIGSPNMSRRGLRHSGGSVVSPSELKNLNLRSRSIPKRTLDVFSDGSDEEEAEIIRAKSRLDKSILSSTRNVTDSHSTVSRTTSEFVDYGLDDSDSDIASINSLSHITKPLIRKGRRTSLLRSSTPIVPPADSASELTANSRNGISNIRMANHITKTTVRTTSDNGEHSYRLSGQFETTEPVPSWKDKFSEWNHRSITTVKTVTSVIVTVVALWTFHLTENVKKLKTYCSKPNQSYLDLSVNTVNSERNKSTFVKTTVMSRTQTVLTTTEKFYERYQEKRRNHPFLLGWLPVLLLLLLFLPFCVFWLRQPSESFGATASSISSRSWRSIIPSTITQSFTDFIQWSSVVFLSFFSLLWNMITSLASGLYHIFFFIADSFKVFGNWLWNIFYYIYGSIFNAWTFPSSHNEEIIFVKASSENSWIHMSTVFASESLSAFWNGVHIIKTSSETLAAFVSSSLFDLPLSLWNCAAWLCLGLWSTILFVSASIWAVLSSISSQLVFGIYSVLGSISYLFTQLPPLYKDKSTETPFLSEVKLSADLPESKGQSYVSSDVLLSQILQSPQLLHFITSSLDKNLINKGISKEEIDSVVRAVVSSELNVLRSDVQINEKNSVVQMSVLNKQQENLLQQIKNMEMTLGEVKLSLENENTFSKSAKTSLDDTISKISADIQKLTRQFDELQKNQEFLKLEVRSCCHSTSLSLEDVESHVNLILSDILGFRVNGRDSGTFNLQDSLDTSQFGAWLGSYFVAKEDLENKLIHLKKDMGSHFVESKNKDFEQSLQETMTQTTQIVMGSVLKEIRSEMQSQQELTHLQLQEVRDSSKSELEAVRSMVAKDRNSVEESYHKVQEEASANVKLTIEETFHKDLPKSIVTHISQAIDLALKKQQAEQGELTNEHLDVALNQKLDYNIKQMIKNQVAEVLKDHFPDSQDDATLVRLNSNINIGLASTSSSSNSPNIDGAFFGDMNSFGLNESFIMRIVNNALSKYDADKTGMVDHALESAGGTIVSTRCTEGYQVHQAELTVFGYPIYRYSINTPRSIIQPDRMPGQCYAFKGSQGFIVIQFAGPVKLTAFSLEHIPKALSPTASIDSASKDFSIFGLQTPNEEGFHLGDYVYKDNGEPLQYFPVINYSEEYFKYVELKVNSNHGNIQYTCIYRFRVHGVRQF